MNSTSTLALALAGAFGLAAAAPASAQISMTPIGSLKTGLIRTEDPRIAEINAYDAAGRRVYVVNPLDGTLSVIDVSDPAIPVEAAPVDIFEACEAAWEEHCPLTDGLEPNSVAIHGHLMAVAAGNPVRTDNGHAVFFWLREGAPLFLAAVEVGAVPDMITFSDFGRYVLVANEGEPNAAYTIDPPGSVSIIDLWWPWGPNGVRHVGFEAFDDPASRAKLQEDGVRIFGPAASVSTDLEPEYIAVEGNTAYVTLQENNALAIIDIAAGRVEKIVGLGLKDHSTDGINKLDASDQGGVIAIANWPVHGMYQPDAIYAFRDRFFRTFLIMANEGDAREYTPGLVEAVRLGNAAYPLDPTVFPNAAALKANTALGRLNVSKASGDIDGDGDFDRIDVFGARSVSIRDSRGRLVWDSGDMFERLSEQASIAGLTVFNTTNTANTLKNRSDDKGVEPESVVVGEVKGRPYAFVGLERDSGIVVLDLSKPAAPAFVTYVTNRKLPRDPVTSAFVACNETGNCGDLGPEGLTFVAARQSPTGKALLIVSNEVSSTTTIWQIE